MPDYPEVENFLNLEYGKLIPPERYNEELPNSNPLE